MQMKQNVSGAVPVRLRACTLSDPDTHEKCASPRSVRNLLGVLFFRNRERMRRLVTSYHERENTGARDF
jgi:hypothetical protein